MNGLMWAGAGKCRIEIPEGYLAVEGFTEVRDPIHARAVRIRQEGEGDVLLVSLELTSLPGEETELLRGLLAKRLHVPEERIWICVTHSFSSPHLLPERMMKNEKERQLRNQYRDAIRTAVRMAADAASDMQPARLGYAAGTCKIAVNRDVELEEGWWTGTNPEGKTNPAVSVIRLENQKGDPIAFVVHYAMQSSVLDQSELTGGGKAVTPDVAGIACAIAEEKTGAPVTLFLIGAAGDQAPAEKAVTETFVHGERIRNDLHEAGFEICARLSAELADEVCRLSGNAVCVQDASPIRDAEAMAVVPAKKMNRDLHSLRPDRKYRYEPDGEAKTAVWGLRLGTLALLGVRPELNCVTARSILEKSKFEMTLLCTMVNGSSKYMADAASYDRCTYEAMNSPFGRGAAEQLADTCADLLTKLKD